jgi:outer membrane protein OmpA-like peptidoglycan-associated protein
VAMPVRAYVVTGGREHAGVPRQSAGFGDLEASAKLQVPIPGRSLRLGMIGEASFATGSSSRGFTIGNNDLGLGGLLTIDMSRLERFPPTRLHFGAIYHWNRNEEHGFGLAPLDDVRQGGFWPPAYPPTAGTAPNINDQLFLRGGIEFSTPKVALFTELAFDDSPHAHVPHIRQLPWVLAPGGLVRLRNGLNLKGSVDISLQRDDPPATVPHLPEWRFTLGLTWRRELTLGDRDHDGIPDKIDQCPNEAEDLDGFQDEDGCPDLDNDGDGIPDSRDLAPNLPEDKDGFQDDDGRPDLDNDGDGIPDTSDKCADTPVGTMVDSTGCPLIKTAHEAQLIHTGMIRLTGIKFDTNKSDIRPEFAAVLDSVSDVLTEWPVLQIEIGGHTDSRGDEKKNLELSQHRAQSVLDYIKSKKPTLDWSKYTVRGYGEIAPIADNNTPDGQLTNRRVEFRVLNPEEMQTEIQRRMGKGAAEATPPSPGDKPPEPKPEQKKE